MRPELSVPVIWVEDGGAPLAGRVDLGVDGLALDGGTRTEPRTRTIAYSEIASVRVGRSDAERIDGRRAVVLDLRAGGSVSFVGFDRPGAVLEIAHRIESSL